VILKNLIVKGGIAYDTNPNNSTNSHDNKISGNIYNNTELEGCGIFLGGSSENKIEAQILRTRHSKEAEAVKLSFLLTGGFASRKEIPSKPKSSVFFDKRTYQRECTYHKNKLWNHSSTKKPYNKDIEVHNQNLSVQSNCHRNSS
jgi:hypothetical protein